MTDSANASVAALRNIGAVTAAWLYEAGIHTRADLEALGPVEAYWRVTAMGHNTSLNLAYALQAAILDIHWTELPSQERDKLRRAIRKSPKHGQG